MQHKNGEISLASWLSVVYHCEEIIAARLCYCNVSAVRKLWEMLLLFCSYSLSLGPHRWPLSIVMVNLYPLPKSFNFNLSIFNYTIIESETTSCEDVIVLENPAIKIPIYHVPISLCTQHKIEDWASLSLSNLRVSLSPDTRPFLENHPEQSSLQTLHDSVPKSQYSFLPIW